MHGYNNAGINVFDKLTGLMSVKGKSPAYRDQNHITTLYPFGINIGCAQISQMHNF